MDGRVPGYGLSLPAGFARAATRYWLGVFPAVARELRRRRDMALAIPDPVLRRLALESLERKRCNLEGAAAFELLAGRATSAALVRALTACQTMCDYLDLLAEQPATDPVANGYRLHEALMVALAPGEPHRRYYAHNAHCNDGGYLRALIRDIRVALPALPALHSILGPLGRMAERIAVYQSFNHGDARGSYEPFERWACSQTVSGSGLRWWETGGAAGSTLGLFALMASAADCRLERSTVAAIEQAYFPWIGALHSMLDSLADLDEDMATGERGLIGCYDSPQHAAVRMEAIAGEALRHAKALPAGRRHTLILVAMTGFYMCDTRACASAHVRAVAPALQGTLGGLTTMAMTMMRLRHAARRPLPARATSMSALEATPVGQAE
jgi:tetraprenyl-beta-curcumene synthase